MMASRVSVERTVRVPATATSRLDRSDELCRDHFKTSELSKATPETSDLSSIPFGMIEATRQEISPSLSVTPPAIPSPTVDPIRCFSYVAVESQLGRL